MVAGFRTHFIGNPATSDSFETAKRQTTLRRNLNHSSSAQQGHTARAAKFHTRQGRSYNSYYE